MAKLPVVSSELMDELLKNYEMPLDVEIGSLIEGTVLNKKKNYILVDIGGAMTGMISGKETKDAGNTAKKLVIGDTLKAVVIGEENDEGFIPLSLRESSQKQSWDNLFNCYQTKEIIKIRAREANKGGLLVEVGGITGFLPVSQLAPLHYPRVDDADGSKILQKLQKLLGVEFEVRIIAIEKDTNKLIFSEKAVFQETREKELKKLKIGDKIKGKVSGIVKFGIFVSWGNGLEGLVHISEIDWGKVTNPENYGAVGSEVEALVIGKEGEKISLSIKQLSNDPWLEAAKNIKIGQIIKGKIDRVSEFGAFLKIDDQINGLIHLSEIVDANGKSVKKPDEAIKVGDEVETKVIAIEPGEHRIGLSMKLKDDKKEEKTEKSKKSSNEDEKEEKEEKKPKKAKKEKETEE